MELKEFFNKYRNCFTNSYTFEVMCGRGIADRKLITVEVHSYEELLWRIENMLEEYYREYNTHTDIWIKPVILPEKIENIDLAFDIKD